MTALSLVVAISVGVVVWHQSNRPTLLNDPAIEDVAPTQLPDGAVATAVPLPHPVPRLKVSPS